MSRPRRPAARFAALAAAALLATVAAVPAARAQCPGDCDGSGRVTINELVLAVNIALGTTALSACAASDRNGDGQVSINELLAAVNAVLNGCPVAATATATSTAPMTATAEDTPTVTPTATPTVNQPPVLPTAFVYRSYPGFPVHVPLAPTDPEGGAVQCAADPLPAGATFTGDAFDWTPTADQLGPFYVPFSCADDATPPAAAAGQLTFAIAAPDPCSTPTCDPSTGCTSALPPLDVSCCAGGPAARVAEPAAGCPEGRVLYIGRNALSGFGRLQDCDRLRLRVFNQAGAEILVHIETRCVNTLNKVHLRARMEAASATHPLLFDAEQPAFFLDPTDTSGFLVRRNLRFGVNGPAGFFDLENAEANLTMTLTDSDGVAVSTQVRVVLTSEPSCTPPATIDCVPDLPDVDPTPTPTSAS
jgi:hypothetical protein